MQHLDNDELLAYARSADEAERPTPVAVMARDELERRVKAWLREALPGVLRWLADKLARHLVKRLADVPAPAKNS